MKKVLLTTLAVSCISVSFTAIAQQDQQKKQQDEQQFQQQKKQQAERKEQQEIIIRSKADTDINLKVEINGDKVIINGKPLVEFKEEGVTVNKRKMIFRDESDEDILFNFDGADGMPGMEAPHRVQGLQKRNEISHKTFLGVTTEKTTEGAKIVEVAKGSAAEKAGLKKEDVISKIGDQPVTDGQVLADIIANKKPKEEIKISFIRAGEKMEMKAVLGERIEERNLTFNYSPKSNFRSFKNPRVQIAPMPKFDLEGNGNLNFDTIEDFKDNMFPRQKKLGLKIQDTEEGGNVKVIDVETASAAEKAGLKKDDIILEINGQKINNTDDAREQLQQVLDKSAYTIKAKRNGAEISIDVKIPKKLKTANL